VGKGKHQDYPIDLPRKRGIGNSSSQVEVIRKGEKKRGRRADKERDRRIIGGEDSEEKKEGGSRKPSKGRVILTMSADCHEKRSDGGKLGSQKLQ